MYYQDIIRGGAGLWLPWRRPECFGFWQPDYVPSLVFGGMGAVTATGSGPPPTVALANVPNGPYQLRTEITVAGDLGDAEYRTSLNGGGTWPYEGHTAASVDLTGSGITEQFAAGTYALDNVYTSNAAVAQLRDRSRAAWHASQAVLLDMPTVSTANFGGLLSLSYNGVSQRLVTAALATAIPQPVTWYIAYKAANLDGYRRLIETTDSGSTYQIISNSLAGVHPYLYDGFGSILESSNASDTNPHTLVGIFDSTDSMIALDAAAGVTGDAGLGDVKSVTIGGPNAFDGQISCVCGIAAHDNDAMVARMLRWFSRYGTM